MTKQEIKDLITAKIAGQGNQVDSGGALDAILNAIIDAIPEGGGGSMYIDAALNIHADSAGDYVSEAQALQDLGLTAEQLAALFDAGIHTIPESHGQIFVSVPMTITDGHVTIWIYSAQSFATPVSTIERGIGEGGVYGYMYGEY